MDAMKEGVFISGKHGRQYCLFLLLVIVNTCSCSSSGAGSGAYACAIDNGSCVYHVQLAPSCHSDGQRDSSDTMRRIADLEQKMDRLMYATNGIGNVQISKSKRPIPETKLSSKLASMGQETAPPRTEEVLLSRVQEEFSRLRLELLHSRRNLRDAERSHRITRIELNKTKSDLSLKEEALSFKQSDLENLQNVNDYLVSKGNSTQRMLDRTKRRLAQKIHEVSRARSETRSAQEEVGQFRRHVRACQEEGGRRQAVLEAERRRCERISRSHDNLLGILNKTQTELRECYSARTSVFCDFEDASICGFMQDDVPDDVDWTRGAGGTPSWGTGPEIDHTCGTSRGHYMYVEASGHAGGDIARLTSPRYRSNTDQCITFYYHMYGRHTGTLSLHVKANDRKVAPMWRAYGNQGNHWTRAHLSIPRQEASQGYQLVFQATLGAGALGDVAIDDFRVTDGTCTSRPRDQPHDEASDLAT